MKNEKRVPKPTRSDGPPEDIFGCRKGEIEIESDILSPVVPSEDWEVLCARHSS
jgi:hypothetical protein